MVTAFFILSLVVDDGAVNLYLTGGEVALEVLHISGCVPEAPLLEAEEFEFTDTGGGIGEGEFLDLSPCLEGYEEQDLCCYAVLAAFYGGVVHTVTALVEIKRGFAGFPAGIPDCGTILDIIITAT